MPGVSAFMIPSGDFDHTGDTQAAACGRQVTTAEDSIQPSSAVALSRHINKFPHSVMFLSSTSPAIAVGCSG